MSGKCGICEWSLSVNGPGAIECAGRIGFEGIQLSDLGGAVNCFPLNDPNLQAIYRETAERWQVVLQSYHLQDIEKIGGLQKPPDSTEGQRALRSIQKGLEVCQAMKIPILMVTSYGATGIVNSYDVECTAKTLSRASSLAREHGVQLVYESILQAEYIQWILEYVGEGNIRLCFDILNPIKFLKGNPVKEIAQFGTRWIDHVHLKDCTGEISGFCQLGEGYGRFWESVNALRNIGYDGWYITENFYQLPPMGNTGSVFQMAKQDLETMRGL